jgi:hypothetical protein
MSFKTTDEDLKRGDLVRVWSNRVKPSLKNRDTYSQLAVVSRYYRPNVASSGCWLFYNHKGEFSCGLHRVELVR